MTPRESETLNLLSKGLSNKQIARSLHISQHGAKRHVANVIAKLNCPNRTLAVALAFGVPSIAADIVGLRSLVAHGVTGLLVEPRSPAALAAALARLIADPSLRVTLADAGFERATKQFSLHSGTDLLAHRFALSLAAS